MKYTMAQVVRKIRGSEGKIEDAKMAIWHFGRVIRKRGAVPGAIIGGIALITGATLGLIMFKKKGSHWQKKKLEVARTEKPIARKKFFERVMGLVAFASTISTIMGTVARVTKKK